MKNIKNHSKMVQEVLEVEKDLRAEDPKLFYMVCFKSNPMVANMSFHDVMFNLKKLGLPKPESVRRCRQKIQADCPELRPSEIVEKGREEARQVVLDYVSE